MKVYGYVKRGKYEEGSSDTLVEEAIRRYCQHNSMELVSVIRDSRTEKDSGISLAFKKLIKDITLENVWTVVLGSQETLSKDKEIQKWMTSYILSKGITICLVDKQEIISQRGNLDKNLREAIAIQGGFRTLDRDIIHLEMLKRRNEIRQSSGKCEGRKSYQEVAPATIMEIKRLRRNRQGKKRRTYAEIAKILNQSGFRTLSLGKFTGNNVSVILHRLKKTKQGGRSG